MSSRANTIELLSPAKVNLMLSVQGPREDGFHELTSIVVALDFGDWLRVAVADQSSDSLACEHPDVPTGSENLILQAAERFRAETGTSHFFDFELQKRIPMGAGLGGGSSNATNALKAMNALAETRLSNSELSDLAAELGSDCPFFVDAKPALMRGRGEVIEPLEAALADALKGQRIVLFQPDFAVNTRWAYKQLRENAPQSYEAASLSLERFEQFAADKVITGLLYNSFEAIVTKKYAGLACLLEELRGNGIDCLMSGSGSCCFAIVNGSDSSLEALRGVCENAFGSSVFWVDSHIS